jgi:Na+-translocating ferredoxin:NAD+ oxidoreductase subunit B
MNDLIYDQLMAAIELRGGAFPAIKCQVLRDLLEAIFSEEDAQMAIQMPNLPTTVEEMAQRGNLSIEEVRKSFDIMARKGIVLSVQLGEKRIYNLLPLIPGILENQMMKGEYDERAQKISKLTLGYLSLLKELEKTNDKRLPSVPFARVIAVEKDIDSGTTVQPYDKLLGYLDKTSTFAQTTCHCRHMYELLGDLCPKPKDVCLALGPGAQYIIEYGLGKAISREEARNILQRAEDAGLVHVVGNTGKNIDFICNCCICHCDNLKAFKRDSDSGRAAKSSFVAQVQADNCVGCGNCIPRCPMEALTMDDDELAYVNKKGCIGCGLCISACPSEAIVLQHREEAPVPYANSRELNKAIVSSISINTEQ